MIQIDMPMPTCCDECFALDDYGDYPFCMISQDQRGYTFNTRKNRMPTCPLKVQEPRLVTPEDFENADEYGFIPVWCEETNKNCYWNCIPRSALETAKDDRCRYWTAKPSLKQMEETPWES